MLQQVKDIISGPYFRYRSFRADQGHRPSSISLTRRTSAPQHVLIIIVDALRPDFVPDFDGFSMSHAITPASWTFPAVTSIHSGEYPHEHGAVVHTHPDDDEFARPKQAEPELTLPAVAEATGYETYGGFGFSQPFIAVEEWYQTHRVYHDAAAESVLADYQAWRDSRDRTFAYLHLSDLHIQISPPEQYISAHNVDMSIKDLSGFGYDYTDSFDPDDAAAQRFLDHRLRLEAAAFDYVTDCISRLLTNMADDSVIVVTGDHGEALYEHADIDQQFTDSRPNYGVGHGGTPFDAVARVPVAVSDDHLIPTGGTASLVDLPATLGHELTAESLFDGHIWQESIPSDRIAICEASRYGAERKAAYLKKQKIIKSKTDNLTLTAEIDEDGEQFRPIPDSVKEQLVAALPNYWDDFDSAEEASWAVEEQLKDLGYK